MSTMSVSATAVVDAKGRIITLGAGAEEMFATTGAAAAGKPLAEVVAPNMQRRAFTSGWTKARRQATGRKAAGAFEACARRADGTAFDAQISLRPLPLGEADGFLVEVSETETRESRYETLWQTINSGISSIDMGYAVTDADGLVVTGNRSLFHPLDPAEAVGKPAKDVLLDLMAVIAEIDGKKVPSSLTGRRRLIKKLLATDTAPVEVRMQNGRWRWLTGHRNEDGSAVYFSVDITEVKEAQLAGAASEERFRFILEQHPMPVWMADLETGEILFGSRAGAELLGHSWPPKGGEVISPAYESPAERDRLIERLRHLGTVDNYEAQLKKPDGSTIWISANVHLTTFQGREVLLSGVADLTERKQQEELFRFIMEHHPLPVWMNDFQSGEIIYESVAAARQFGREWNARGGTTQTNYYANPKDREAIIKLLERDGEIRDHEVLFKRADGSTFWVTGNARLAEYGGRKVILAGLIDVTARKEREAEIRMLLENYPMPVWLAEADTGRVLFESPSSAEMFGRTWGEKSDIYTIDHYIDIADRERIVEQVQRDGEVHGWEVQFKREDGTTFWATGNVKKLNYRGKDALLAGVMDVTSRKEREEQIRFLLERHPLPVWLNELESGMIIIESPAAAKMFGREWNPSGGASVFDAYVNPEDRAKLAETLRKTGEMEDFEAMFKRVDGTPFWARGNIRKVEFRGKEMVLSGITDVTAQKMREEEIIHARELLSDAIEALDEGFALYDRDDRLVMCNTRYREMNALSADVLVPGVKWVDFLRVGAERGQYPEAEGRIDEWLDELERIIKTRRARELKEHDDRWYLVSDSPTRQGGTVVTRVDITDRKLAEEERRKREAVVRQVLDACPVPLQMTRVSDGRILYRSPATVELFGDITAAPNYYANPEDRKPYIAHLERTGEIDNFEVELVGGDGKTFWGSISSRLIEFQGERVIVSNTYDLTERRSVEAELASQRDALHLSEKLSALGELLAGVAHELNNPLSVVVGQALLLKEQTRDPKISERAAKIGNAADRCARIVKTFLAMARQQPAQSRAVDINEIVEGALEVTGYGLRTQGIDLKLELAEGLPAVWIDTDQVHQVFTNLIVNAEQALSDTQGPKVITVTTALDRTTNRVRVGVRDNGPGIQDQIKTRIFEPFFTTKEVGTGTGIGLAFCHRIIETHGGTLSAESDYGNGAVFTVELPISTIAREAHATPEACSAGDRPLSVLVIDDEADVVEMIGEVLRADGHLVATAHSGVAALQEIEGQHFDIILSDLRMPNLDGHRLFEILERRRPELSARVAFVTGDTMSPQARSFLKNSGRPYIEKPVRPEEIRKLVGELVAEASPPA